MIRLLIFDYDGVLFDTKKIAFSLVSSLAEKYLGKTITKQDFIDIFKSNFYDAMKKEGVSREDIERIKAESTGILMNTSLNVHAGIRNLVKSLAETHTLAVISSNYDRVMKKNLKDAGILGNFHFIMGTEEGESKKEKINSLLKKTKTRKSEALLITDTVGDIREAKKAGIKTMAVTWGFHPKQILANEKPDFIADNPQMMQEALA